MSYRYKRMIARRSDIMNIAIENEKKGRENRTAEQRLESWAWMMIGEGRKRVWNDICYDYPAEI